MSSGMGRTSHEGRILGDTVGESACNASDVRAVAKTVLQSTDAGYATIRISGRWSGRRPPPHLVFIDVCRLVWPARLCVVIAKCREAAHHPGACNSSYRYRNRRFRRRRH